VAGSVPLVFRIGACPRSVSMSGRIGLSAAHFSLNQARFADRTDAASDEYSDYEKSLATKMSSSSLERLRDDEDTVDVIAVLSAMRRGMWLVIAKTLVPLAMAFVYIIKVAEPPFTPTTTCLSRPTARTCSILKALFLA